ncbi:hypothetical protein CC80DRAFT_494723 [Byssothecium circinans]|uniref:Wax synthase domain-containing protein n=1 Tax=Byssothecium circinans TaxID=147558 RepID=A0A6A5TP29_9PLEO|nr:hypothetical protein CC80DRAFT_494723 [Byssothecium circinans]
MVIPTRRNPPRSQKRPTLFKPRSSLYPPRWTFVSQQAFAAITCYLLLGLLGARKPSPNASALFSPDLIPIFTRLNQVTAQEVKLRALTIGGFAVTFYCIIQGLQSIAAATAVGLGLSLVEQWRPAFGSIADAYTLGNVWGKFWHQLLREPLTGPSTFLIHNILHLPPKSPLSRALTLTLSFALSGALHTIAGISSGMPLHDLGVFRFFCTQAFGVLFEHAIISVYHRLVTRGEKKDRQARQLPSLALRALGFLWVGAFMTWSGPAWIYPQAVKQSPKGAASFLPFSILQMLRKELK